MRSVKSFFHRDSHVGVVGRNPLRDREDIEIHTWHGKDDPDNPYVCYRSIAEEGQHWLTVSVS